MKNPNGNIKIAIVDDHNLFRKGLIKLINLADVEQRYSILFEADNGKDMQVQMNGKTLPDIILMDIDMPDMDGYTAVSWLRKYHPDIKILVISMFESEETVIRMTRLHVNGYLSKYIEVDDMHRALDSIVAKGYFFSESVSAIMARNIQGNDGQATRNITITETEREFIKLACSDRTYLEIADQMNLSPKTIDGYRESLFKRLQVKTRTMLAIQAIKLGFVHLDEL